MNLHGRGRVHAQDLIIVKVALLDAPVLEGNRAIERRRDAEHDRALDLRLDGVGIDRALGSVGVETILKEGRRPSRDDRGAREAMIPGDRHPIRIETYHSSASTEGSLCSTRAPSGVPTKLVRKRLRGG